MNRGKQRAIVPRGAIRYLASVALIACSSNDGSEENSADSANGGSSPAVEGGAGPQNEAPASPPPGSSSSETPGGSGTPAASSEPQNEALPLTPAMMMPAGTAGGTDEPASSAEGPLGAPMQQPLTDLVSVRQEHAVAALGGEIYVIGGFTPMVTGSVEAFNPATDTWRAVASLPTPLHHANAATIDGRIYVAGFYLGGSFTNADARVLQYDPGTDAWSERAPMPAGTERASACVAALDGKLYVFGGARATTVTDASVYDVAADSWQALPPLPEPREHCVAGAIAGSIYIASGRAGGITGFQPNTWQFDPATETYTPRAPIATPRGGTAGAVLAGRLIIVGGEGNPAPTSLGVFTNVEAYDPLSDSWQALPPMLQPRHGFGAAASEGRIFLPGGAAAQGFGAVDAHTVLSFAAAP
ncbi:MAG: hypothetical protein RL685_7339 [Pseudomonadota bacterium]|jgi:N-acetylneuraminic acid mutarotase